MVSSGALMKTISASLGLPEGMGNATLQALRKADLITKKGRGASAADMAPVDAATILTAMVSGAVVAQVGDVTTRLLDMRHILSFLQGTIPKGFAALRTPPSPFYRANKTSTLRDGLTAVFEESWHKDVEFDEDGNERYPGYDTLHDENALSFTLGMDGGRSGGFALIRARVSKEAVLTRFYSTWPLRTDFGDALTGDDEEKRARLEKEAAYDPWVVFGADAKLLHAARVTGAAFKDASESLSVVVPKTRQRVKRYAQY